MNFCYDFFFNWETEKKKRLGPIWYLFFFRPLKLRKIVDEIGKTNWWKHPMNSLIICSQHTVQWKNKAGQQDFLLFVTAFWGPLEQHLFLCWTFFQNLIPYSTKVFLPWFSQRGKFRHKRLRYSFFLAEIFPELYSLKH